MKVKKIVESYWQALTLSSSIDHEWDRQCDNSFLKFLDVTYYTLLFAIIAYPTTGMIVLLLQNYGK